MSVRKEVEDDDPMELVGVMLPDAPDHEADIEMARTFVLEYRLLGWQREGVRHLFDTPAYAGTHGILRRRGTAFVDERLDELFGEEH